jgi:predicted RNA-binding Zn-ribbon protein involved in translation (DUF1610 family)
MAWTPVKFSCGHYLAMGEHVKPSHQEGKVTDKIWDFLPVAAHHACPMCGSATGKSAPPLKSGERRYLVHNRLYYREMPPEWEPMADQNFLMARLAHPERGVEIWHSCPNCGTSH